MKADFQGILDRMARAARVEAKLTDPGLLSELPPEADEQRWLLIAAQRLAAAVTVLRTRLEQSLALPELKPLRQERAQRLEQEWLVGVRQLFEALVREVGLTSPLVESLFPHQRFEKLERGGAVLRAFRTDYETRRASSYVRRLEADPEHPRLAALLAGVDRAGAALAELTGGVDEVAADAMRVTIAEADQALERTLLQARALCEAALIEYPSRLLGLGFHDRPKKRPPRPPAEQAAEPS